MPPPSSPVTIDDVGKQFDKNDNEDKEQVI